MNEEHFARQWRGVIFNAYRTEGFAASVWATRPERWRIELFANRRGDVSLHLGLGWLLVKLGNRHSYVWDTRRWEPRWQVGGRLR